MDSVPAAGNAPKDSFQSTRWTLVLAAGHSQVMPTNAHQALSELCQIYWRPLYLFGKRALIDGMGHPGREIFLFLTIMRRCAHG